MTVIDVGDNAVIVAEIAPNSTDVPTIKFSPTSVTLLPPAGIPNTGLMLRNMGALVYVNRVLAALAPYGVVTMTEAAPEPAGVVAVIWVLETTFMAVAATPPTVTPVASVKLVPLIVITVPPAVEPVAGATLLTVGGAP